MSEAAIADKEAVKEILGRLSRGEVSYDAAAAEAQPIIDRINERSKEAAERIAKKYNMKPRYQKETFISLRRSQGLL